jgi:hypothetical protein
MIMDCSYYLLSTSGIDVTIIPELDCRLNIIDPDKSSIDPEKGNQVVFANILSKELAFQVVGKTLNDTTEIIKAIRWYSIRKTFAAQDKPGEDETIAA